jgi:hypothetical protein
VESVHQPGTALSTPTNVMPHVNRSSSACVPASRRANNGVDFIITMGVGIIPGDRDRAGRMLVDQGLPQLDDLLTPCAAPEQHHGFTRLVVNGAHAIPFIRLTGRGNHHGRALCGLHSARRVGSQLTLNASASEKTPPVVNWLRVASLVFFCADLLGPDC